MKLVQVEKMNSKWLFWKRMNSPMSRQGTISASSGRTAAVTVEPSVEELRLDLRMCSYQTTTCPLQSIVVTLRPEITNFSNLGDVIFWNKFSLTVPQQLTGLSWVYICNPGLRCWRAESTQNCVDSQQLSLQGGHVVIQQFHVFKIFHRVTQVWEPKAALIKP